MKHLIFIILTISIGVNLYAQTSGTTGMMTFVAPTEVQPAILQFQEGSIKFTDASGNRAIDAMETCIISFTVKNTGLGDGTSCVAKLSGTGESSGISFKETTVLDKIPKGGSLDVKIPITADMYTQDGRLELTLEVEEPNGFGTDPTPISVATHAYVSPYIQVADYSITGTNSTTLKKKELFDLQILLQNTRLGTAEDVNVSVSIPEGVMVVIGNENQKCYWDKLIGGQQKELDFTLIANDTYKGTSIPINVIISEKYGRYAENKTIELAFDQSFASSKIDIREVVHNDEIAIASYSSQVDKNIPTSSFKNDNTFVFIIANENYTSSNFAKVPYALNDGRIFRDYCEMTLGVPNRNITYLTDATYGRMQEALSRMKTTAEVNPNSKIIFYYAGHGAPSEGSQDAYLIPTDAFQVRSGYCINLQELYDDLEPIKSGEITVFLDACFSGSNRDNKMMASARGVAIVPKSNTVGGNLVVFSAATGDETAWPYNDEKHGMFTYFLLKKLQETSGNVSYKELYDYLYQNVRRYSNNVNNKVQTPTVNPSFSLGDDWQTWKLK